MGNVPRTYKKLDFSSLNNVAVHKVNIMIPPRDFVGRPGVHIQQAYNF